MYRVRGNLKTSRGREGRWISTPNLPITVPSHESNERWEQKKSTIIRTIPSLAKILCRADSRWRKQKTRRPRLVNVLQIQYTSPDVTPSRKNASVFIFAVPSPNRSFVPRIEKHDDEEHRSEIGPPISSPFRFRNSIPFFRSSSATDSAVFEIYYNARAGGNFQTLREWSSIYFFSFRAEFMCLFGRN